MDKEDVIVFKELKKARLIVKVYDPQANEVTFALTPKGAEWLRLLASCFQVPKKKRFNLFSRKVEKAVNTYGNPQNKKTQQKVGSLAKKFDKGMMGILNGTKKAGDFFAQFDKASGGAPKLSGLQRGEFGSPTKKGKKNAKTTFEF